MSDEKVLISVHVENQKDIKTLREEIKLLRKDEKDRSTEIASLNETLKKNTKLTQARAQYMQAEKGSINKLDAANKYLRLKRSTG